MKKSGVSPKQVAAMGIDAQMAGIMAVDADFEAVGPYDSWLDTRCSSYIKLLESEAGDEILTCSGGPVTGSMLPKYFGGSISVRSSMRRRRHLCFRMAM